MGAPLREVFAKFTTAFDPTALLKGAEAVEGLFGKLQNLGSLLVEGAIVGGLVHMVEKTVEAGRALVVTSEQVGISTDALNLWQKGAQLAGVEADDFTTSLRFMQRNAYEAATAGGEQAKAFRALGVNVKDSSGQLKDADTLLRELADGFQKTENPAKRVAIAQQLFGRAGARLLPVLKDGSAGVEAMRKELEDLGISFETDWTEKAEEAHREQTKFNLVLGSLRTKLAVGVLPIFTKFFTLVTHYVGALNKAVQGTNAVKAALITLGAVAALSAAKILIAFAPLIASTLAWGAVLGFIVLAIDEVITTLQGGDSILRRWIDDTWGAGATDEAIKALKDAWDALVPALEDAWHWLQDNVIPSAETVSRVFKALGQDIAFVVDQFRHLGEFKEGIAKIAHDIGVKLGISNPTGDEARLAHGAEGFGSASAASTANGIAGNARGGEGFFGDFTRFPSEVRSQAGGAAVSNSVTINVGANAKPDPELARHIEGAVTKGLDKQNRKVLAAVQGT